MIFIILADQVNTALLTETGNTPFEMVFGRPSKPTPQFGKEEVVVEDGEFEQHEHSYSTAYGSEQSYAEVLM